MTSFFSIIYIKPNRNSEERIAFALVGVKESVPFYIYDTSKLNFGLKLLDPSIRPLVRKGVRLLEFDINKYRNGLDTLPLFDVPISIKLLKDLAKSKRGKLDYSLPLAFNGKNALEKLSDKYLGMRPKIKNHAIQGIHKDQFLKLITHSKLNSFDRNITLSYEDYPIIFKNYKVDLFRKGSYITVFQTDKGVKSRKSFANKIAEFLRIVQCLKEFSIQKGLGKGRFYFVTINPELFKSKELKGLMKKSSGEFEIIHPNELYDKV